ncbi:MAG: peptide chain release factor 1 [Patescibacteria group bacterium]
MNAPQEQQLRERLITLENELAELSTAGNSVALRRASEEHREVTRGLALFTTAHTLTQRLAEAETLIRDEDAELRNIAEIEVEELKIKQAAALLALDEYLHPADPRDNKNTIIEIRAAAGGDEAGLFAGELLRMYNRYAETHNWRTRLLSSSSTGIGGYKEVIFAIEGERVYSRLKFESGVHRVQRVPDTEKSGRIHTSTATVAVMAEADEIDITIDPKDLDIKASTAGGHGGQSVNTTYSAIRILHRPSGIVVQCQDERNFQQNKIKAMEVLRARLFAAESTRQQMAEASARKEQVGTGERSEKIRTYNVPQDRVTDHRLSDNFNGVQRILDGNLDDIIDQLKIVERAKRERT